MEDYQKLAAQMEKQIQDWQAQVAKLGMLTPPNGEDAAKQYKEGIDSLSQTMSEAQVKLADLHDANTSAWKEVEKGGRKAFEEWQKGWEKAMKKYTS